MTSYGAVTTASIAEHHKTLLPTILLQNTSSRLPNMMSCRKNICVPTITSTTVFNLLLIIRNGCPFVRVKQSRTEESYFYLTVK